VKSLFVARITILHQERSRDTLVLFNASSTVDELALAAELRNDLEENLEPHDVVIVVNDAHLPEAYATLDRSTYFAQAIDRYRPGVRLSLVGFDGLGREVRRRSVGRGTLESDLPLAAVIRPCLTRIFRLRGGFVEASPNYHFENPSGKHTTRFIRLSNLISHHAEIAFMAFCILPAIPEKCTAVYTDTPAVFPLIASVNEHRRYTPALSDFVPTENFSSYSAIESGNRLDPKDSVVLISASSSGSLANDIHNALGYPKGQIWHMLFNGPAASEHQVICDLGFDAEKNPEGVQRTSPDYRGGSCAYCAAGSFPIPLKGDQFELPGPQLDAIQLARPDEPTGLRRMIASYAGKGVFGVGMGARQSGFARQYNVNALSLAAVDSFVTTFDYILLRSLPFACEHVIYLDKPSRPLADEAVKVMVEGGAKPPRLLSRDQLGEIPLGVQTPVVVIAAVVESGRSLLDLSRDLRSICTRGPLIYVIGLSKTNGSPRREDLDINLAMADRPIRHEVVTCERVLLPSSSEGHAWHRERELLARMRGIGAVPDDLLDFTDKRLALLRNERTILYDDLFWTNGNGPPLKVQPGFVFADRAKTGSYLQADVFFTVSSVLQKLRAAGVGGSGSRGIRANWFQQTLLSPENFGRFNDGAIQASLLRAGSPRELNYSGDEDLSREAARIIGRIVRSASETRGEAAAEFLIAIATRSLLLRPQDLSTVLQGVPDLPRLSFLRAACDVFAQGK